LLLGSHLDTVPHGGRYDGTLGVLAALEVLRTVKEAGILKNNLTAKDAKILSFYNSLWSLRLKFIL